VVDVRVSRHSGGDIARYVSCGIIRGWIQQLDRREASWTRKKEGTAGRQELSARRTAFAVVVFSLTSASSFTALPDRKRGRQAPSVLAQQ